MMTLLGKRARARAPIKGGAGAPGAVRRRASTRAARSGAGTQRPSTLPLVPESATATLSAPGQRLDPRAIGELGPALRPLVAAGRPSRVAPTREHLSVGGVTDREERQADEFAGAAIRELGSRREGRTAPPALSAAERHRLEAVRIHTDAVAAGSAELLGAEAYAVPDHIVFGPSRYDPASLAGRRLLAHELVHALSAPATAPVLRRQPKTTPAPPPPLQYDTGAQTFSPPAPGTKLDDLKDQVTAKQTSGELGKTVSVTGATAGTPAELYLWNALVQRAAKSNWGTELDSVTAIGPAPAGGAAPLGRITIQLDASGNAHAMLIASGGLPAISQFKDVQTATASLVAAFGFSKVVDGSATWTPTELSTVSAALSRLPQTDRAALNGVDLVRQATIVGPDGKPRGGQFSANQSINAAGTTLTDTRQLEIADSAFSNDAISFIGGAGAAGPMSFETILHEAGHAVENKARLDAKHAELAAQGTVNRALAASGTAVATVNAASTAAATTFNAYSDAQKQASKAYFRALQAAIGAIDKFANETSSNAHPASEQAAQKTITARDKEKAALPAGNPAIADWAALSAAQDVWFASAQTSADARSKLKTAKDATAAVSATVAGAPGSKRLKAFVDFVNAQKIKPLTTYAKDNWPAHPEEFYAEAYSIWLNDPDYLASQLPALKTWFDQGNYRV